MQKMKEKIFLNFLNKIPIMIILCSVFVSSAMAQDKSSADLDQLLDGLEKRYSKNEFMADFSQVSKLKVLEIDETASGKAMFSHPGKMKWEYLQPQQHQIITNGKSLWIYRPDQNQVLLGNAQNFFKQGSGGAFLSDIAIVRKKYNISIKESSKETFTLSLIPQTKTPEIQSILMIVSKENYNIQKIITSNIYEDTIEITFHKIEFKDIDDSVFNFNIPENTNVIQMEN